MSDHCLLVATYNIKKILVKPQVISQLRMKGGNQQLSLSGSDTGTIAQSGQYNFERSLKRDEPFAVLYSETKFCSDVISLLFLLNRRYAPFYKWMHRAVKALPVLGREIYSQIQELITCKDYPKKAMLIEDACRLIIKKFHEEGLSDSTSDFLLDHGPVIQNKIQDARLRQRNVWVD